MACPRQATALLRNELRLVPSSSRHAARLDRTSRHQIPTPSLCSSRCISTTPTRRAYKTVEQAKARNRMGPFSVYSLLFFGACGGGMYWYFKSEKERLQRKRIRDQSKGYGKPRIGGEFDLIDQNGTRFTSDDLKGKFSLIYFGFSHCPDICPDELDKMGRMIDQIHAKRGNVLRPLVVTCDPARDTPGVLKRYLSEFHSDMIGLTGSWDDIKAMCKKYRVYFSTPPHVKPGQDYLVDHSIYFYLMDPDGDFIEVIGREHSAEAGAKLVTDHIDKSLGRTVTKESWKEEVPTDLEKGKGWIGKAKYKPNLE